MLGGMNPRILGGYRHEFGSLLEAAADAGDFALIPETRFLILHLIAAHHGRARPHTSKDPRLGRWTSYNRTKRTGLPMVIWLALCSANRSASVAGA